MHMKELCTVCGLTRKAVEYYVEQGFVRPAALENGYREFCGEDAVCLRRVSVLRRLGLSTAEIRRHLDGREGSEALLCQRERAVTRAREKLDLLSKLARTGDFEAAQAGLETVERGEALEEKLLRAFPGYFGRFISLHFAGFMTDPIETEDQRLAFSEVIGFLDQAADLAFPQEAHQWLDESAGGQGDAEIKSVRAGWQAALEKPEDFLLENRALLEERIAYKGSEAYQLSEEYKITDAIKHFQQSCGYAEIFIPAMRRLSPAYKRCCEQLAELNRVFLLQYPELSEQ